jgi:signal transduction histidine kinase
VRINDVLARLNGKPVEAHLGRTVREMVDPAVADFVETPLRGVLERGAPVVGLEFSTRTQPNPRHQWVANYFPVRGASGELLGIGAVVVDITRHKEAEAALSRSVAFREELLAVLGHDLRNPLNAIGASAFQLSRAEGLEEDERRAVERIRRSTGRMGRMIADILDFARSRLGEGLPVARQRMDMAEVSRAALEELQVAQPERRILFEARGDTWGTWDADRVAQVLGNLVSNSLQHGRLDTPVRVRLRGEPAEVWMEVHNEGEPIAAERLPNLFDPFKGSARPGNSGSLGLGLYIVEQIARAHGGGVSVTSTAEAGTTFTVRWPREPPGT